MASARRAVYPRTIEFKDHFSSRATEYASHRPVYPPALIDYFAQEAPSRSLAWDCGCGSGQMSLPLARVFDRVIATDASAEQIAQASGHPRVEYGQRREDQSGLDDASADLVVAAQAAHWFNLPAFYAESRRVLRPGGIIALVTYDWLEVDDRVDPLVRAFYTAVGPYWPPERRMVEDGYASVPFPFAEFAAPVFVMRAEWNAAGLLGYIRTWSAVRGLEAAKGDRTLVAFERDVRQAWGEEAQSRTVRWRLALRIGRK